MCCIVIHVIKIIRSCNFNPPPRLGGHEIHSFGIPSLAHYYYLLSVFLIYVQELRRIFILNNAFSLYYLYGHVLEQEPLLFYTFQLIHTQICVCDTHLKVMEMKNV